MDYLDRIIDESRAVINKSDLSFILPILIRNPIFTVLEVGTGKGYSAELWYKVLKPQKIITIENNLDMIKVVGKRMKNLEFNYIEPPIIQVVGDSTSDLVIEDVKNQLAGNKIDLLFLDGSKREEVLKKDFYNYGSLVSEKGIIFFHNTYVRDDPNIEVWSFWNYIKTDYAFIEIKGYDSTGCGLIFL